MAQFTGTSKTFPELDFTDYNGHTAQVQALEELQKISDNLPDGKIIGAMIRFGVADGYAHYRVVSSKPLKVEHIPFLDAYQVSPIMIRGLRRSDVEEQVRRSKARITIRAARESQAVK